MSRSVEVTKATELDDNTGQSGGMIRKGAIVGKGKICATVMIAKPHSGSEVHHHGEQDSIVYCVKGHGTIISDGGRKRQPLEKGDFAIIPAFVEHQEVNDGDDEVEWIITRSGGNPIVQNLEGWSDS